MSGCCSSFVHPSVGECGICTLYVKSDAVEFDLSYSCRTAVSFFKINHSSLACMEIILGNASEKEIGRKSVGLCRGAKKAV